MPKRVTAEDCNAFLSEHNLELLSDFIGSTATIKVRCLEKTCGATLSTSYRTLWRRVNEQGYSACKLCSGRHSGYLEKYNRLGSRMKPPYQLDPGQTYRGMRVLMRFLCPVHGRFDQTLETVEGGLWCPDCHADRDIK